jgi:hypothetical protein
MTKPRAFMQLSSVAAAVEVAVAVTACFVLFAITDRSVSPFFTGPRERDAKERVLAVNLGDLPERAEEATASGAALQVPPAPFGGATLRRDLPNVGSDDRPPGVCTGRARARDRHARGGERCARPRGTDLGYRRFKRAVAGAKAEDRRYQTGTAVAQDTGGLSAGAH